LAGGSACGFGFFDWAEALANSRTHTAVISISHIRSFLEYPRALGAGGMIHK
jgi:hypothetical protein